MTDNEAYAVIGERAEELTKVPEIQKKCWKSQRQMARKKPRAGCIRWR